MTAAGKPGSVSWLRLVLGGVYAGMAAGQLASFDEMTAILSGYRVVSGAAATALAVGLIAGEAVCGLWFLARPRSRAIAPVLVYTAVSLVWAGLAVQAYARGLVIGRCGCFGVYLSQRLGWPVLVQDALTLLYAVLLLRAARRGTARRERSTSAIPASRKAMI
jgi:hypothetical protein